VCHPDALRHLVEDRIAQALEGRDALPEALAEVEFAAHGALGDLCDHRAGARMLGEQFDDLVMDERGVHIEHHQESGRRCGLCSAHGTTGTPLPTTVRPDGVTVKPRARSRSGSTPILAPSLTMTSLSRIARPTKAFGSITARSKITESTTCAP